MNGQQPIDLSGGFVPQPKPAPPAGGGGIDLSAGFVQQAKSAPAAAPPAAPATGAWQSVPKGTRIPTEEEVDQHIRDSFTRGQQEDLGWNLAQGVGSVPWKLLHGVDVAMGAGESGPLERFTSRIANVPVTGGAQKTGEAGGNILGFFAGDELLGLLGNMAKVGTAGEALVKAKQIHDTVTKIPMIGKLLGIGLDAVNAGARAGTVAGGQEYAMTGGQAEPAAETGLETAGITTALSAMFHVPAAALQPVARYLAKIAPKTASIAGHTAQVLPSQMGETGRLVESAETPPPEMQAGQQAMNRGVVQGYVQKAYETAVNKLNAASEAAARYSPFGQRALPAPEAAPPVESTFTMDVPTQERPIGMVQRAAEEGPVPAEPGTKAFKAQMQERYELAQRRSAQGEVTPTAYTSTGAPGEAEKVSATARPGTISRTTKKPMEAIGWKGDLEHVMTSPEWEEMSPADQEAYVNAHKNLSDQLNMHYAANAPPPGYRGHMPLINPYEGMEHLETPGQVADALQGHLHAAYGELDRESIGKFNDLRKVVNEARQKMADPDLSDEVHQAAQDRFVQGHADIADLLERNKARLTPEYYNAMKSITPDVKFLENLDALQERFHNGIKAEWTKAYGLPRMMRGNLKQMGAFLREGNNEAKMTQLMGPEAVPHFLEMHSMLNNAATNRPAQDVLRNVAEEFSKSIGGGAMKGGLIAAATIPVPGAWHAGAAAGAAVGGAGFMQRQVLRAAMNDSRIGKAIMYAAKNNVSRNIYAPLIARMLVEPLRQQQDQSNTASTPQQAAGGTQ
jgi:hypothetical protein